MKNLLSKSLLCGVLASTFLIVNCQKAPNRAVKAQVTPSAKPSAVKSADCSEAASKERDEAKKLLEALDKAMAEVKDVATDKLTPAQIENLNKLINDLNAQSKKFIAEIQKITVGDKKETVEACKTSDGKTHEIAKIQSTVAERGAAVKAKTGVDNDATKDAAVVPANNKIELNDELTLTDALAKLLADEAQKDKSAIVAGKILTAEADVKKALEDKAVTACKVSLNAADAKNALVKDAKVLVSSIDVKDSEDKKRKLVEVALGIKAESLSSMSLLGLSCNLAEGKDANVELRSTLGALVSQVTKAAPAPVVPAKKDPVVASGDSSKASGDSTVASADPTKAKVAQEGLDILNAAAARK